MRLCEHVLEKMGGEGELQLKTTHRTDVFNISHDF